MKTKLLRGFYVLVAGFALLLGLRICYGYFSHPLANSQPAWQSRGPGFNFNPGNYASAKFKRSSVNKNAGGAVTVDQKYERIADTSIVSSKFE